MGIEVATLIPSVVSASHSGTSSAIPVLVGAVQKITDNLRIANADPVQIAAGVEALQPPAGVKPMSQLISSGEFTVAVQLTPDGKGKTPGEREL